MTFRGPTCAQSRVNLNLIALDLIQTNFELPPRMEIPQMVCASYYSASPSFPNQNISCSSLCSLPLALPLFSPGISLHHLSTFHQGGEDLLFVFHHKAEQTHPIRLSSQYMCSKPLAILVALHCMVAQLHFPKCDTEQNNHV